ncbi:MAG: hypothetical protein ACRYG4_01030 [Janthinobacterium lividum]
MKDRRIGGSQPLHEHGNLSDWMHRSSRPLLLMVCPAFARVTAPFDRPSANDR